MMQSKFLALQNLIEMVKQGLILTGTKMERLDEQVEAHIKALKRHRMESEYAETEFISTCLTVRNINDGFCEGAIIFQTPVDGKQHPTSELVEADGSLYFPKDIIEQM